LTTQLIVTIKIEVPLIGRGTKGWPTILVKNEFSQKERKI